MGVRVVMKSLVVPGQHHDGDPGGDELLGASSGTRFQWYLYCTLWLEAHEIRSLSLQFQTRGGGGLLTVESLPLTVNQCKHLMIIIVLFGSVPLFRAVFTHVSGILTKVLCRVHLLGVSIYFVHMGFFSLHSRMFHLYVDVTITDEGL